MRFVRACPCGWVNDGFRFACAGCGRACPPPFMPGQAAVKAVPRVVVVDLTARAKGPAVPSIDPGGAMGRAFPFGLPRGWVVVLSGDPSAGKSTAMVESCVEVCAPRLALEGPPALEDGKQRARYLCSEDEEGDMLVELIRQTSIPIAALGTFGFSHVVNLEHAEEAMNVRGLDLVIVDSFSHMALDENSRDARKSFERMGAIARRRRFVLVLIAHLDKRGKVLGGTWLPFLANAHLHMTRAELIVKKARVRHVERVRSR